MAKKKSLKQRIDALVDALGAAKKPTLSDIRSELVTIGGDVEALESAQALADKDAHIAALQSALEKSQSEMGNLHVSLKQLNGELEAFRAKQREEEHEDIQPDQLEILRRLPSKHGGKGLTMLQLWGEVGLRLDEVEIRVDKLEKAGLIECHTDDDETFWRRTMRGNELVVAKRLAGEEPDGKGPAWRNFPKRSEWEEMTLMALASSDDAMTPTDILKKFPPKRAPRLMWVVASLLELRDRGMAMSDGDDDEDPSTVWRIRRKGLAYLSDKALL